MKIFKDGGEEPISLEIFFILRARNVYKEGGAISKAHYPIPLMKTRPRTAPAPDQRGFRRIGAVSPG